MPQDPKLRSLPSGKFTRVFVRGRPVFDETGLYAVTVTLLTDKGSWYWDGTGQLGTRINTLRTENASTAATLSAQGQDALRQVEQLGRIDNGRAEARRIQVGRWQLSLSWRAAGAQLPPLNLTF